jgi:hypothetical protein
LGKTASRIPHHEYKEVEMAGFNTDMEHDDLQRARIARAEGARQSKKLMHGIKEFYSERRGAGR